MNDVAAVLNDWAVIWSGAMLSLLWQSTLLALVVGGAAWLLRRGSPGVRYWLWQIVALKLLILPFWTLSLPAPRWLTPVADQHTAAPVRGPADAAGMIDPSAVATARADVIVTDAATTEASPTPMNADESVAALAPATVTRRLSWPAWLMIGWGAVVFGQWGAVLWQRWRLGRLLGGAVEAGPELQALVERAATRLALRRAPRVRVTEVDCSPFVCGLFRPTVVLPRSVQAAIPAEQLEPVVLHELAHVKRLDLLWNWIPQIARMLFFFHPVAHWVAYRIRLEAELACDGWAMRASGRSPGDYADLLIRVVSRLSEPAMIRSGSAASAGLDGNVSWNSAEPNDQARGASQ